MPLKVYDNGAVPPVPVRVTVAVPPLHNIGVVIVADPVIAAGWVIVKLPVTGVQPLESVTLQAYTPAGLVKIPIPLGVPSKVYVYDGVPPAPISLTVADPPKHDIGVINVTVAVSAVAGWVTV
jgi:hypothetical protein